MDKRKVRDFTQGPLLPQLLMFALPLIATSVLQLLFNTADIIVVGRWGGATPEECETSLAAVGSCGSLINLLVNLFMGLSIGAGVCVAHGIGAKQYEDVKKVGFQYVDFMFEEDDIIFLCRTAVNNAHSYHNSNYQTFHRIENFREL